MTNTIENNKEEVISINSKITSGIQTIKQREVIAVMDIIEQLKPNMKIQYVTLENPEYSEQLLSLGIIKETKKGGKDTYVVPKEMAYCS